MRDVRLPKQPLLVLPLDFGLRFRSHLTPELCVLGHELRVPLEELRIRGLELVRVVVLPHALGRLGRHRARLTPDASDTGVAAVGSGSSLFWGSKVGGGWAKRHGGKQKLRGGKSRTFGPSHITTRWHSALEEGSNRSTTFHNISQHSNYTRACDLQISPSLPLFHPAIGGSARRSRARVRAA